MAECTASFFFFVSVATVLGGFSLHFSVAWAGSGHSFCLVVNARRSRCLIVKPLIFQVTSV